MGALEPVRCFTPSRRLLFLLPGDRAGRHRSVDPPWLSALGLGGRSVSVAWSGAQGRKRFGVPSERGELFFFFFFNVFLF